MTRAIACACVLACACAACGCTRAAVAPPIVAHTASAADGADVHAIRAMLGEFQRAILAHDGAALTALLASPTVPFEQRVDGTGELTGETGGAFAAEVAGATERWEEQFTDVVITPAADIAVLDARYTFAIDGAIANRGREIWILIATPHGWKIASVTWTDAHAVE